MKILSLVSRFASSGGNSGGGGIKIPEGLFDGLPDNAEDAEAAEQTVATGGALSDSLSGDDVARRCALLLALRPYVSDTRQRAIDVMVGLTKLSAFFPLDEALTGGGEKEDKRRA